MKISGEDYYKSFDLLLRNGAILLPDGEVKTMVEKYEKEMKKNSVRDTGSTTLGAIIVSALISGHIFGKEDAAKAFYNNQKR